MPFASAAHCKGKSIDKCITGGQGGFYCKGNEIWNNAHSCEWSGNILTGKCIDNGEDVLIRACIKRQFCLGNTGPDGNPYTLCSETGKCITPYPDVASCEYSCTSCPPGQICVDKNPFGPGCVKSPQTGTTTTSGDFYTLANIKENLKVFLFPLLGLFIFIIILVFFVLGKKNKRRKK